MKKTDELINISNLPLDKVQAYNIKGDYLFKLERFSEAEAFYKKSYKINPSDIVIYNINEAKLAKDKFNNSSKSQKKCIKYDFENNNFDTRMPIVINYFSGIHSAGMSYVVATIMQEVSSGNCDFHINIDSGGGDPNNAFAAFNTLKTCLSLYQQ